MEASTKVAIYCRVSTIDRQTNANQERELREVAQQRGWEVVAVYSDKVSGFKGRDKRPGFDSALKSAVRGEYNTLMAWAVDRLGRSTQDLLGTLGELHGAGCDLYVHRQAIDTRTPAGKAMYSMMGVFSELERDLIRARVLAGLRRAKDEGKVLGRPRIDAARESKFLRLRKEMGIGRAADGAGIGRSAALRIEAAAKK